MEPAAILKYYLRREVQEGLAAGAKNREAAVKYGESGFGKRPDAVYFPNDVGELAKKGATSFHVSEERWSNPLALETGMRKTDSDALRTGWDLVLDIDAVHWGVSKMTAWLMVKSLQEHGIKSVSVKFSGNKGWHIGVPFEAFPEKIDRAGQLVETRLLFPEAPRMIATYLLGYITAKHISVKNNRIYFAQRFSVDFDKLKQQTKKEDLIKTVCAGCDTEKKANEKEKPRIEYGCEHCGNVQIKEADEPTACEKCSKLMRLMNAERGCQTCGAETVVQQLNTTALIEVDTVLISSRHLYRAPYSLHEKSGLMSLPIAPEDIMTFDKQRAAPPNVTKNNPIFLDTANTTKGEAMALLRTAIDFGTRKEQEKTAGEAYLGDSRGEKAFEKFQTAAPETLFPPCIAKMLQGMKDGKKRAMFVLINFLASVGWDADAIEKRLDEWNKKNAEVGEALRETVLTGRLRYHRQQKRTVLPPNCDNAGYYSSMGLKCAEQICTRCTNPVQYVRRMMRQAQRQEKEGKKEKRTMTDEQKQRMKEARRGYKEFREKMKEGQTKEDNNITTEPQ
ncbi:MAG: hypothetical protein Q7R76_01945 [Candidatus Woesearchaeota archaeon]|nr:hypothetical protein [Candidatus Woesearchaeota archaeon]